MGILFKYRRARHRRILAFRPFVSTLLPPLFFPFSLFFFFSSKKINVIDLSSIPVLLYHRFFYSFIFNSSARARVLFLRHYLSLVLFFGSFKGKEIGSKRRREKSRCTRSSYERATRVSYRSFIARKLKIERKRKPPVAFPRNPNFFSRQTAKYLQSREKGRCIPFR